MSQTGSSPYQSFTHSPYGAPRTVSQTPPVLPVSSSMEYNNNNSNSYCNNGSIPSYAAVNSEGSPTSPNMGMGFRGTGRPRRLSGAHHHNQSFDPHSPPSDVSTPTMHHPPSALGPPNGVPPIPPQLLSPKSMVVGYNPAQGGTGTPTMNPTAGTAQLFSNGSFFKPNLTSPHQRGLPSPNRGPSTGGHRSSPHGSFGSFPAAARSSPPTVVRAPSFHGANGSMEGYPSEPPPHLPPSQRHDLSSDAALGTLQSSTNGGSGSFPGPTHHVGGGGGGRQRRNPSVSSASVSEATTDFVESESMVSGSSTSSLPNDLPLCPNDSSCVLINDKKHQRQFSHSCRLFPCYHAHVKRHAKLFRHAPGQVPQTELASVMAPTVAPVASGKTAKQSQRATLALASVNFSHISPDAPNAVKISVSCKDKAYDIFGDWTQVKVHTLKRYLHQVFAVPPRSQRLFLTATEGSDDRKLLDDDLAYAGASGVIENCQITIEGAEENDHNGVGFGDL